MDGKSSKEPWNLEREIREHETERYNNPSRGSNIVPSELANSVVESRPSDTMIYVPSDKVSAVSSEKPIAEPAKKGFKRSGNGVSKQAYDIFLFFPRAQESLDIRLGFSLMYVALKPSDYGFSDTRMVALTPKEIEGLKSKLSPKAAERYAQLLSLSELPLNYLLESVGFIVNHSMAYDKEKFNGNIGVEELQKKVGQYKPEGHETMKGICTDAGNLIRQILFSLNLDGSLGVSYVQSHDGSTAHDTTLVFDKKSGEWAVINSKSPFKPYNLVPKDKLEVFGTPYSKIDICSAYFKDIRKAATADEH